MIVKEFSPYGEAGNHLPKKNGWLQAATFLAYMSLAIIIAAGFAYLLWFHLLNATAPW